jgi:hypothetical protein
MASEFRAGLAAIAPVIAATIPIGLLFGALAAERGLGPGEVALMSLLVFAGAAQFVVLDLWAAPLPVAAVVLATLVVNLRHVMMGLSLGRRLGGFTRPQRLGALYLMADEVWALAEARGRIARLTPAYYAGLGLSRSSPSGRRRRRPGRPSARCSRTPPASASTSSSRRSSLASSPASGSCRERGSSSPRARSSRSQSIPRSARRGTSWRAASRGRL